MAEAAHLVGEIRPDAVAAYAMLRTALAAFALPTAELTAAQRAEVEARVERELVIEDAVLASDMAQDVTIADTEVTTAMRELQSRYEKKWDFLVDLAHQGLDRQGLRQALSRELKVAAVLAKVDKMAPAVSEADVRAYYVQHRERFSYPETREAQHILVTVNDAYPENSRETALKSIERIRTDIGKDVSQWGERFGEQASKHSECPTAMQQGRLGRVRPGQLYPELDAALFRMQAGDVSGPVETEIGFHLLYCEEIHPASVLSYEQAEDRIREHLQQLHASRHQRAWLASLVEDKEGSLPRA